jgi:hypothetical protein
MKIERVDFVNVVNFGGSLRSATTKPSGANPGEGNTKIDLTEDMCFVMLTKSVNGKPLTKYVPMTNISSFQPVPPEEKKAEPKK